MPFFLFSFVGFVVFASHAQGPDNKSIPSSPDQVPIARAWEVLSLECPDCADVRTGKYYRN